MELIERDKAIRAIAAMLNYDAITEGYDVEDNPDDWIETASRYLKDVPTVEERKTGKWKRIGEPPWYLEKCSECGCEWMRSYKWAMPNYCGNCGARMEK